MKDTYLKVISEDLSEELHKIKTPTVIIWGDKDNYTLVEDAYFINQQIENSKLIILPGANHELNRKVPDILAKEILNSLSPR